MAEGFHLETDRLLLRRPEASDLAAYTRYCQSARSGFVGGPFRAAQAFDKFAAMIGHWNLRGFGRFVVTDCDTGRPLGHVGAIQQALEDPVEMTWTLWGGSDEGKGLAAEACRAYLAHASATLSVRTLVARVHCDNHPSRRLAERLGGYVDGADAGPDHWPNTVAYRLDLPVTAADRVR